MIERQWRGSRKPNQLEAIEPTRIELSKRPGKSMPRIAPPRTTGRADAKGLAALGSQARQLRVSRPRGAQVCVTSMAIPWAFEVESNPD
ncbi:hypothetical protein NL676_025428 [Syzygium grande]|nr:hypothetical protein NL676_025428 [Syzygium grande]